MVQRKNTDKSIESWIWDAACSIRGAKNPLKFKDYIFPSFSPSRLPFRKSAINIYSCFLGGATVGVIFAKFLYIKCQCINRCGE